MADGSQSSARAGVYSGIRRMPCTTRVSTAAAEILRIRASSHALGCLTGVCASLLPSCTEKIEAPSVFHLRPCSLSAELLVP